MSSIHYDIVVSTVYKIYDRSYTHFVEGLNPYLKTNIYLNCFSSIFTFSFCIYSYTYVYMCALCYI